MVQGPHPKLHQLRIRIVELRTLSRKTREESRRVIEQSRKLLAEPHDLLVTRMMRETNRKSRKSEDQ